MVLYDGFGRPVDIRKMIEHYSKQESNTTTQFEDGEGEWSLKKNDSTTSTTSKSQLINFQPIDSSTNIQELGNKEARLGDTIYLINVDTGELYKKYVDFMTGQLHIESAKFTKGQIATPLLTVDKLHDMLLGMAKELEELKGRILDNDTKNSSGSGLGMVQQEHKITIQPGDVEDTGNRHSVQSGSTVLSTVLGGDGTSTV